VAPTGERTGAALAATLPAGGRPDAGGEESLDVQPWRAPLAAMPTATVPGDPAAPGIADAPPNAEAPPAGGDRAVAPGTAREPGSPTGAAEAPRPDPARAVATAMLTSALASADRGAGVSGGEEVGAPTTPDPTTPRPGPGTVDLRARSAAGEGTPGGAGRAAGGATLAAIGVRSATAPAASGADGAEPTAGRNTTPVAAPAPAPAALVSGDWGAGADRRGPDGAGRIEAFAADVPSVPAAAGAGAGAWAHGEGWPRGREGRSAAPPAPPVLAAASLAGPAPAAYLVHGEAAAAADAAQTPPPAPADMGPFGGTPHEQIVRAIRLQWAQGIGEAHLRLSPAHLGEVTIRLRVEHGIVTASLRGESAVAIDRIRAHEADLRAALEEQGLTLDGLELVVDPDGRRRGRHAAEAFFEPPPRRPSAGTGSTFEVTA
jgi:flagellar hook-length control protein FliK